MKILCISGKARHGKDTCAEALADIIHKRGEKSLIIHNADLLKFMCKLLFGWNGVKDEYGRHILQYVGTDVIRKQQPDYWVDFIKGIVELFPHEWDYVIIPDCRFPNEIDRLRESGNPVIHLRVLRKDCVSPLTAEQQLHPSETALDDSNPDFIINNDTTIEDLYTKLQEVLDAIGDKSQNPVVLYSTGCPKCEVLKRKLAEHEITYAENKSVDEMLALGITAVPVLQINGQMYGFTEAVKLLNSMK